MSIAPISEAVGVSFASQCDRGKVREENQDSVLQVAVPLGEVLILAGGIGGFEGGGVAARMAVEAISASLSAMPTFFPPAIAIQEAASRANAEIAAAAAEPGTPNNRMGTTVVLALLQQDPDQPAAVQAWIGHIGDSRAYVVHDGRLNRITRDHSAVQLLLDHNLIAPEEARNHADASVLTRTLGYEPNVEIELDSVALQPGDSLLLCSDGLWGYVPEPEIERILADPALTAEESSRALLNLALDAGGHDNVSVQIARLAGSSDARVPPASAKARASESHRPLEPALSSFFALAPEPPVVPAAELKLPPTVEAESRPITAFLVNPVSEPAFEQIPGPVVEPVYEPVFVPVPGSAFALEPPPAPESKLELVPPAEVEFESPPPFRLESVCTVESEPIPAQRSNFLPGFEGLRRRISAVLQGLACTLVSFAFPFEPESGFVPAQNFHFAPRSKRPESRLSMGLDLLTSLVVQFASPLERASEHDPALKPGFAPQIENFEHQVALFLKLLGILLVAFGTSCGLVYLGVLQNWFGVDSLLR